MSSFALKCCLLSILVHTVLSTKFVPNSISDGSLILLWLSVTLSSVPYMVNHILVCKKSRMLVGCTHLISALSISDWQDKKEKDEKDEGKAHQVGLSVICSFSDVRQKFASVLDSAVTHPVTITRRSAPDILIITADRFAELQKAKFES